jgi:hypothetical protein
MRNPIHSSLVMGDADRIQLLFSINTLSLYLVLVYQHVVTLNADFGVQIYFWNQLLLPVVLMASRSSLQPYVLCLIIWGVMFRFVDIDGIVDHHHLNFPFI